MSANSLKKKGGGAEENFLNKKGNNKERTLKNIKKSERTQAKI